MAKIYAIILGAALIVIGIMGSTINRQHSSASHNALHLLSGLAGLTLGFVNNGKYARGFALGFGLLYTLVALMGFADFPAVVVSSLNVNATGNLIHLAVGLLSIGMGFAVKQKPAAPRQLA